MGACRAPGVPVLLLLLLLVVVAAAAATVSDEVASEARAAPNVSDEMVAVAPMASGTASEVVAGAPMTFEAWWKKGKEVPWTEHGLTGRMKLTEQSFQDMAGSIQKQVKGDTWVQYHPLLFKQALYGKPSAWLFRTVHGLGVDRFEVCIRLDNLYLSGFTNAKGQWFDFKPNSEYGTYKIPGATTLPFSNDYRHLVGHLKRYRSGAWENLVDLDVGKDSMLQAAAIVANYDPSSTPVEDIKLAVAKLVVFLCETQRFPYIWNLVNETFEGRHPTGKLDHRGAQLVVQWARISCALLIWNIDQERWDGKEVDELKVPRPQGPGIDSKDDALAAIWPILQATRCSVDYRKYPMKTTPPPSPPAAP